ncbi:hypothetical protein DPEC_G00197770 [Dallia pectoralis]|uniref:Uncharacterized protein n=1 Tax=Dallia pectoralis TaxID=75939 RepID=A0ACC2G824_DALPE|nr:hypothetical protein DPEC_G00197770 [Dallia pectoralis]
MDQVGSFLKVALDVINSLESHRSRPIPGLPSGEGIYGKHFDTPVCSNCASCRAGWPGPAPAGPWWPHFIWCDWSALVNALTFGRCWRTGISSDGGGRLCTTL